MKKNTRIQEETVRAIETLLTLFTPAEMETLAIKLNDQKITLAEQFVGRWWSYIPVASCQIEFRAAAAQKVALCKNWIQFIEKINKEDIFAKLLNPDNYKEVSKKETIFKMTDKRSIDSDSSSGNLVRSIARTIGGEGGISKSYDYGSEWDRSDRERLDKMSVKRDATKPMVQTETGEEDDTRGTEEEENQKNVKGWITKKERLDITIPKREAAGKVQVKFNEAGLDTKEEGILLHAAQISQSANATTGETLTSGNTFIDSLKRQNYDTTRERIILANAINNIHNIDFLDVREQKIFKKLDELFVYRKSSCP